VREAFGCSGIAIRENDPSAILAWFDSLQECDSIFSQIASYQVVNRIPNISVLCRKAPLARLLERISPFFPSLYSFVPKTFVLPFRRTQFLRALAKGKLRYIIKPDTGSLGQGICIVSAGCEYDPDETMAVAQEYLTSMLLDNKKFDFRLYALVAQVQPLEIFVYRDGLARFCLEEVTSESVFGQLTNVAINHDSRILSDVLERLRVERGVDIERLWRRIDAAIALTIISAYPVIAQGVEWACPPNGRYSRCFQILGFDVLLDPDANPFVLEVNYRPSLDTHFPPERRLKVELVREAVAIGAPLRLAQKALCSRKWGWTDDGWRAFLQSAPEIERAARAQKELALSHSRFQRIWPSDDPERAIWGEVLHKVKQLPIERMPGVSGPIQMDKRSEA
jgi:hypothetical protein